MNFIQRIHGQVDRNTHAGIEPSARRTPFWVRHYDKVVNIITLGRTAAIHRQTLALANVQPGETILDVGCGTGALLLEAGRIAGPNATLVGLDVEPAMIEQARARAIKHQSQATFETASVDQIPYPDNTFDIVFSTLMYHHLSETQKQEGLEEVKRVLRDGGRFILVDINPNHRSILMSLPGHSDIDREDYVRSEVVDRMRSTGFTVTETGAHPSRQLSYAIAKKT